ncbi:MAG TPA: cobyric acid synthase CobQ, partial [Nitrospirota bacterium]|nr:cobyric acid synthase CobQ [Nitrospirota bacterium]
MGKRIADPYGVEGGGEAEGLGYLDIETVFEKEKTLYQVTAVPLSGRQSSTSRIDIKGYEIHMGNTSCGANASPLFLITRGNGEDITVKDGAMAEGGRVWGTYIHGIFDNDKFRRWLIEEVRKDKGINVTPLQNRCVLNYGDIREDGYKRLAEVVRTNLDMERI